MGDQMDDCLKLLLNKEKELLSKKNVLKDKMDMLVKRSDNIHITDKDSSIESWRKANDISDNSRHWHDYNIDLKLIESQIKLLREISSRVKC